MAVLVPAVLMCTAEKLSVAVLALLSTTFSVGFLAPYLWLLTASLTAKKGSWGDLRCVTVYCVVMCSVVL